MAYLSKNLSVLAYANGFTLWHYTTPDTAAAVQKPGYFNHARELLRDGDMILAVTDDGNAGATLFVGGGSNGVVVSPLLATKVG